MDLSPGLRYKKKYVLPGGFVPGPETPGITESFLIPSFRHVSALQKEGLQVWNGLKRKLCKAKIFVACAGADTVGLPTLDGRVGHSGRYSCRIYCGFPGRHKPGVGVYYPVALKPNNSTVQNSDHPDLDITHVGPPDPGGYMRNLALVLSSETVTQYKANQLLTGIVQPSICLGFQPDSTFPIPKIFTLDLMHLCGLNLPQLLISLWRGTLKLDQSSSGKPDFIVLDQEAIWKQHGALVASVRSYLPGTFNRPPRNPAEKINSGYKAIEFNTYFWVLGPAIFCLVLPHDLWTHFCKLVRGIQIHTLPQCPNPITSKDSPKTAVIDGQQT
ncbi:hypothetical protein BDN72DRAFT_780950 [Pluteus cervinus]|uniref:Uncharacterized protein n=1 Tax=Pluteus cervinus TaxID=181527 RepID=A0ACD3A0F3_9AGAR|nr:hypothetical protein BDN72DRAFT_780950 [Pluteus cervinus]